VLALIPRTMGITKINESELGGTLRVLSKSDKKA